MSNSGPVFLGTGPPDLVKQVPAAPKGKPNTGTGKGGQSGPNDFTWHGQTIFGQWANLGSPLSMGPGSYTERRYVENLAPASFAPPLGMPSWSLNKVIGEDCSLTPKSPIPNPKRFSERIYRREANSDSYRFPAPDPTFNAVRSAIARSRVDLFKSRGGQMSGPTRNNLTVLLPAGSYGAQTRVNGITSPGNGLYG